MKASILRQIADDICGEDPNREIFVGIQTAAGCYNLHDISFVEGCEELAITPQQQICKVVITKKRSQE